MLRYKIASKYPLSGPFHHSGVGRNPEVAGPVRSYNLVLHTPVSIHPRQESNMVARGGFEYRGDHLVCPQGKVLKQAAYHRRIDSYQYVALQKDCQACPVKGEYLRPNQKRRYLELTIHYPLHLEVQERNRTPAFRREMSRRQTIVEEIFTSLDRLRWAKSQLRGLWRWIATGS